MRKAPQAKHTCGRQVDPTPDPTMSTRQVMGVWKRRRNKEQGGKVPCQACKDMNNHG